MLAVLVCSIPAWAVVSISIVKPPAPQTALLTLPGSTRRLFVNLTGGTSNVVTWAVTSTTGGATATVAGAPTAPNGNWADVVIGATGGTCPISGSGGGPYTISPTATVTVTATSSDDPTKTATQTLDVCSPAVQVMQVPFYRVLYASQKEDIQTWVSGAVNQNVTWAITSQPGGGNGTLSDTTNRDTVFSATVAGRYTIKSTSVADGTKTGTTTIYVTGNAMPRNVQPNGTEPVDPTIDPNETGTTFEVGSGFTYANLEAFSWNTIPAGSTIRLHNTDLTGTNPTQYPEVVQLSSVGTATQPIRIVGVPDSSGNLPIMQGAHATSRADLTSPFLLNNGAGAGIEPFGINYSVYPNMSNPQYFLVEGIRFTGYKPANTYCAPGSASGLGTCSVAETAYLTGTSGYRVQNGSDSVFAGCEVDHNDNGVFQEFNSGQKGWGAQAFRSLWEGNSVHDNGHTGDTHEHNWYMQGWWQVFQFNQTPTYNTAALGSQFKDRGLSVNRYNYYGTGAQRQIDLVENQDSPDFMDPDQYLTSWRTTNPTDAYTGDLLAAIDEQWYNAETLYGNIYAQGLHGTIHWAADNGCFVSGSPVICTTGRYGNFYFYNNSGNLTDTNGDFRFSLFDPGDNGGNIPHLFWGTISSYNNALWGWTDTTNPYFSWSSQRDTFLTFGKNLIPTAWGTNVKTCGNNPGDNSGGACDGTGWPYQSNTDVYLNGNLNLNTETGDSNFVTTSSIPFSTSTYALTSPVAGQTLPAGTSNLPVRFSYQPASHFPAARTTVVTGTAGGQIGAVDTGPPAGGMFNIPAGSSTATINSTIASAAAASGGNTVSFAAGSYSITSQITIPCPASALTIQGPTPAGVGTTWPITPTAVLNSTLTNQHVFRGSGCNTAVTIQYLEINGGNPAGGGGGALYIPATMNNVTVQYNYIHGNAAVQAASNLADSLIWLDGSNVAGSPRTSGVMIRWNRFGHAGSSDCANLMNVLAASTPPNVPAENKCAQTGGMTYTFNGTNYGAAGYGGTGSALCLYQDNDTEKNVGGYCNAVGVHVNTDNLTISNNSVDTQEQGFKFYEGCSNFPCPDVYKPTNVTITNNDFANIHRIVVEAQQGGPGPWTITGNSMHDQKLFSGASWGWSLPQNGNASFNNSNTQNLLSNLILQNINPGGQCDKSGLCAARACAVEWWTVNGNAGNNLIQGYWGCGVEWGFGGPGWTVNNNNFQQLTNYFQSYIAQEETQTSGPSQVGNTFTHTVSTITSVTPSISPAAGSQTFPLTVTLTDPGYTSGVNPQGNTGIWYTVDGSTPVPGSGTAKYLPSGGTFSLASAATVKAVGMWGALNQPASYQSGFGFVPSAIQTAAYTSGPCGATNTILITTFGAVGDGTTDNTTAIQNTFNFASTNHCQVQVPAAASSFAYSNVLTMNGITVSGVGPQSILKATNATNSAVKLTGTAPSLSNVVLLGTGSTRNTGPNQSEVWVSGATGYLVNNVLINGGSCTGIWDQGGSTGTESNNTVENTLADSITNTNGANQILIQNNLVIHSGDDGISNNSYTTDGNTVNHITVDQNAIMRNANARGLEVSGGSNISFTNNYVDNQTGKADLILTSETSSFQTQPVNTVTVSGNTLVQGGSNSQGDLFLWPDGASNVLSNLTINNNRFQVNNTFTAVQATGAGTISSSTLSNSQAYVTPNAAFFSGSSTGITQTANTSSTTASYPGPLNPIVAGTVPLFSLPAGTYALPQTLTLAEITSGDAIKYCTVGGAGPCTPATAYSGAITLSTPQTICTTGTNSSSAIPITSAAVCATYNGGSSGPAATPVLTPGTEAFFNSVSVSLSTSTPGATIYYTTNGTTPTTSSSVYTAPITVTSTTTIQALAAASGFTNSSIGSGTYTLSIPPLTGCNQSNAGSVSSVAVGGTTQQIAQCVYAASGETLACSPAADKYGDVATAWGASSGVITVGAIGNAPGCGAGLNGPGCVTGISAGTANSTLHVGARSCSDWAWTVTNSPPTLLSATVTLQGGGTAVNVGSTVQGCANMFYTGSISTQLCGTGTDAYGTSVSNWTTSAPANATMVPATGMLTGVAAGTTNGGVTAGSFTPSLAVTVNTPITGVNVQFGGAQISGAQIQ